MDRNRWLLVAALVLLGLVLAVGPRGCTSTKAGVGTNLTGTPGLEIVVDPPLLMRSDIVGPYYTHQLDKTDWLFAATYHLEGTVDLTILPKGSAKPYIYTAKLPGTLVSSNASTVQGSAATWAVNPGYKYTINADSREVRWWLIAATAVLIVAAAFFWLAGRRTAS